LIFIPIESLDFVDSDCLWVLFRQSGVLIAHFAPWVINVDCQIDSNQFFIFSDQEYCVPRRTLIADVLGGARPDEYIECCFIYRASAP
jgi:hypothetical protein